MIEIARGNLLEADADALVNTVNTVGVMGKGIALQFRQAFPGNYDAYRKAVAADEVVPGKVFVFRTGALHPRYIINFPTKRHWRGGSRIEDIKAGLDDLLHVVQAEDIRSIAVPPLGCGNGGLDWRVVRKLIESAFATLPDVRVLLYAPHGAPQNEEMIVSTSRPAMTSTRAALVKLLESYAVPGYRLSLLEVQKLAYFLQAAGQPMKLVFVKHKYGPYCETLNHVLQRMEGHHIRGYGDRSRTSAIRALPGAVEEADLYLQDKTEAVERLTRVVKLIEGFETPYGMELLATTYWVAQEYPEARESLQTAVSWVHAWSERKRRTFQAAHIEIAWNHLKQQGWL